MTFELRKHVPALCGGRKAILDAAKHLLATTHAPIGADDLPGHVTDVVLHVMRENIRTNIEPLLWKHINETVETYQLTAGDPPPGADLDAWDDGLDDAMEAALAGDIQDVVGIGAVSELTIGCEAFDEGNRTTMARKLAGFVADAKPKDIKNALAVAGVKPGDIAALVDGLGAAPATTVAPEPAKAAPASPQGVDGLALLVRTFVLGGGSTDDAKGLLEMLSDDEDVLAESAAQQLGAKDVAGAVAGARKEGTQSALVVAYIMERAQSDATLAEAAPAPVSAAPAAP